MDKVYYGTENYSRADIQDYVEHALFTHGNVILKNDESGAVVNIQAVIQDQA